MNVTPEGMARAFYEAYETFAPHFGYTTRPESGVPWEQVPEANRSLMVAVVRNVLIEQGLRIGPYDSAGQEGRPS